MWLKPNETMSVPGVVLNSGGSAGTVDPAGVAIVFQACLVLAFNIRVRRSEKRWLVRYNFPGADWIHVALTWKEDANMTVYINGSFLEEVPNTTYTPGVLLQTTNMVLGSHFHPQNYGQIVLDEMYVWDEELSATEVARVYNSYAGEYDIDFVLSRSESLKCKLPNSKIYVLLGFA